MAGVEPGLIILRLRAVVVEEDVGQHHGADLEPVVEQAVHRQMMQHVTAEAADRPFLNRDHNLMFARQPSDEIGVERFGKARIGDRRRQSIGGEFLRRLHALAEPRAKAQAAQSCCLRG